MTTDISIAEISILDKDNPRSLINLVPSELRDPILSLSEDIFGMTEEEFENKFSRVDPLVNRVRISFWQELDRATTQMRRMNLSNIAHSCGMPVANLLSVLGIVSSRDSSRGRLSTRSHTANNLAWCLIPPTTYESFLEEALSFGLARVRKDILGAKIFDEEGNMNVKAADLLLKAVAFLDMRKHGSIVQRSASTSSLQINMRKNELAEVSGQKSLKEIEERIEYLESKGVVSRALGLVEQDKASTTTARLVKDVSVDTPYSAKDDDYEV